MATRNACSKRHVECTQQSSCSMHAGIVVQNAQSTACSHAQSNACSYACSHAHSDAHWWCIPFPACASWHALGLSWALCLSQLNGVMTEAFGVSDGKLKLLDLGAEVHSLSLSSLWSLFSLLWSLTGVSDGKLKLLDLGAEGHSLFLN
eukprot:1159555-Pelagomonas_calceolata.AAC.3